MSEQPQAGGNHHRTAADAATVAYAEWLLNWRWLVLLGCIALLALAGSGGRFLTFKDNYRIYFSPDNPQLQAFEAMQDNYTKNDNLMFVIVPVGGQVFTPDTLAAIEELTAAAWQLPFAIRVDSITNFQHTRAEEDDLLVEDLVSGAPDLTPAQLAYARDAALAEPILNGQLINSDASVTAVNVTLQMPLLANDEVSSVVSAGRELRSRIEAKYPGIDMRMTGVAMMNISFFESAINDLKTLVPAMYLGIIIVMLLLVRCVGSTVATVIVIFFSIVAGMGLSGFLGIKLSAPSASAPTVIMTLAVADCIHVVVSMFAAMSRGYDKRSAIVESLRINMQPVFLTSATTAIGFLTMNFSDAPPFRDLGNIVALGVSAAFVFSVVLLPVLLSLLPCRKTSASHRASSIWLDKLAGFLIARRAPMLLIGTVVSVVLVGFIPTNELNDEFLKYFEPKIEFRRDTDFTRENLTGPYQIFFSIPAGESDGISEPEYLRNVDAFASWLRTQPNVMHVGTITDTFKRLNKSLHADDPSWYKLPAEREMAAQYLLLYELSLPFGLDLNNQVNIDKSATKLVVSGDSMTSNDQRALVQRAEDWLRDNAGIETKGVGVSVMFSYIAERNIRSMLTGSILGLILISGILLIALRSVKLGLLSLIPNLLPIGLTFGIWAIAVGRVNMAASVVSGMVLGIVVDDTVHFLSKYLRARREVGLGTADAIRYAFSTVGLALLVTTLILVAGFLILAQSPFGINSTMAILTAMGIALALVVDFLLLPVLLLYFDPHEAEASTDSIATEGDKAYATP